MLARLRKAMDEREGGFTLIELLVVMIIIGILAAIAIPLFLNQKKKATETGAKADATNIYKDVAAFATDGTITALSVAVDAASPTSWDLTATVNGNTETTTVRATSGSTVTVNPVVISGVANGDYCVTVTPSTNGAQPWSADQNGQFLGSTCTA